MRVCCCPLQLLPRLWTILMLTLLVTLLTINLLHKGLATWRQESQQQAAESLVLTQPLLLETSEDDDDWQAHDEVCNGNNGDPEAAQPLLAGGSVSSSSGGSDVADASSGEDVQYAEVLVPGSLGHDLVPKAASWPLADVCFKVDQHLDLIRRQEEAAKAGSLPLLLLGDTELQTQAAAQLWRQLNDDVLDGESPYAPHATEVTEDDDVSSDWFLDMMRHSSGHYGSSTTDDAAGDGAQGISSSASSPQPAPMPLLPLLHVTLLVAVSAWVVAVDTLKLSVACGSAAYWALMLSVMVPALGTLVFMRKRLLRQAHLDSLPRAIVAPGGCTH